MAALHPAPDLGIPDGVKPLSAERRHSIVQGRMCGVLTAWANCRGEVGTGWRCYLLPAGEKPTSLVPDVAFFSNERMRAEFGELRERPAIAPDIAVEIVSPRDGTSLLKKKIELYLGNGSNLVIVVEPRKRTIDTYEWRSTAHVEEPETASCASYPDLRIDTVALFRGV